MDNQLKAFFKKSIYSNQILGALLIFAYCMVYGVTAHMVLTGLQYLFFISSFIFALVIFYTRDHDLRKKKIQKGILYNQLVGMALIFAYVMVYGITSVTFLNGFKLIFFMSSLIFAVSIIYMRDCEKRKQEENVSATITHQPFAERNPCFINSKDLSWLVRELNSPLSTIIGFSELMLSRQHSESEKEYMIRNIYESAFSISLSINKVSGIIEQSSVKPKEIYKVVDLLNDKNFK